MEKIVIGMGAGSISNWMRNYQFNVMEVKKLKKILNQFGENVRFEYDLKKKNWFNIGGKSKFL